MAPRYKALKSLDSHHPLFSPLISIGTEYLYSRDSYQFAGDGWDVAADLFMYESYVLPHPVETMNTPSSVLRYPLDWQPLWVMGELSDLQDLSVSESPAQAQLMHFLQFIAGVVGQVWFVLSDSTPRKLLEGVGTSGAQLNALAPAINAKVTLPSADITTAEGTSVYARVMPMGEQEGCWAVLVANGDSQPVASPNIAITLPESLPGGRLPSSVVVTVPFELSRTVNATVSGANGTHIGNTVIGIDEPLLGFGTQVYFVSQGSPDANKDHPCLWEARAALCSQRGNLIDNCGFEHQHVLGVPDNWLLTMLEVSDPYAGGTDLWASLNTDAAYARTGWYSVRYTSSKPHTSRLQSVHMDSIRPNATYALELWTSSPSRMSHVSLLVVSAVQMTIARSLCLLIVKRLARVAFLNLF